MKRETLELHKIVPKSGFRLRTPNLREKSAKKTKAQIDEKLAKTKASAGKIKESQQCECKKQ